MESNTTIDNLKKIESSPPYSDKDSSLKSVRAAITLYPLVEKMLDSC